MNSTAARLQHNFFLILLAAALVVMYFVFRPFLASLVLAASIAVVARPLYHRIYRAFGRRANLAAATTTAVAILVIMVPLLMIGSLLMGEAQSVYSSLAPSGLEPGVVSVFFGKAETLLRHFAPEVTLDAAYYIRGILEWIVAHLDAFFSGFLQIMFNVFIMVIALFFLLRDGDALKRRLVELSPLSTLYDEDIFRKLTRTVVAIIKGSLIVSVVQGLFAGIGFWVIGVPNPVIWGMVVTVSSLIPGVGTSLVTVPAIVYLFVAGELWQAVALAVWAAFGIGLIDNFLAPYVANRTTKIHPLLIMLAVLGGIAYFGPVGFILGPVMLAFLLALLDMYPMILKETT